MHHIGVGLIIASFVVWVIPPIAPFLPFSTAAKASIVAVAIVAAEIMFWIGALLVGKEAASKLKKYWDPKHWRIKRRLSDQTNDGEQRQDGSREMTTMKK
ncbi:transporter suffix domain-containing protein [Geobacillus stearothermophilus]|uniref:transporter suffix domain-containing protein n=1 Tax=Geobacillus stearothermophilus TaxID=1422 RepID=UPI003D1E13B3